MVEFRPCRQIYVGTASHRLSHRLSGRPGHSRVGKYQLFLYGSMAQSPKRSSMSVHREPAAYVRSSRCGQTISYHFSSTQNTDRIDHRRAYWGWWILLLAAEAWIVSQRTLGRRILRSVGIIV